VKQPVHASFVARLQKPEGYPRPCRSTGVV